MKQKNFSGNIITWYENNKRGLPWRETKDPYIIWLSEIILQQTRVDQGLPYFYKFKAAYPDLKSFALADEHEILRLWQGLGYYSRARNMHTAARKIVNDLGNKFPASFNDLKKLKGIGEYTAAAIASFAFNLPHAVVDGNVNRLLSRHFGIHTPIDSTEGKHQFKILANTLLNRKEPAIHNQAMMELGALICKPRNPDCLQCPVNNTCIAYEKKIIDKLPVKSKTVSVRNRYLYYFLLIHKNEFIIQKRTSDDIWKNLYELPLIETKDIIPPELILSSDSLNNLIQHATYKINKMSGPVVHKLTHQNLHSFFFKIILEGKKIKPGQNMQFISMKKALQFPYPKLIENYLKQEKIL